MEMYCKICESNFPLEEHHLNTFDHKNIIVEKARIDLYGDPHKYDCKLCKFTTKREKKLYKHLTSKTHFEKFRSKYDFYIELIDSQDWKLHPIFPSLFDMLDGTKPNDSINNSKEGMITVKFINYLMREL